MNNETSTVIAAVIGSLKAASVNRIVFGAARELVPVGVALREAPVGEVPFFNENVEAAGDPASVATLKRAVAEAHGLIIFTPEYNGSIPAVTKNAVDWLSRPFLRGPLAGKPVGIVSAGPGSRAGVGVRAHLAESVATAAALVHSPSHGIGRIHDAVVDRELADEAVRDGLRVWLAGFLAFVEDAARNQFGSTDV